MKKVYSRMAAGVLAVLMQAAAVPFAVSAEEESEFHMTWDFLTTESRESTVYIDPADLANGDVSFNAALYIKSEQDAPDDIDFVSTRWDGYDANGEATRFVRFANMSSMNSANPNLSDDYTIPDLNPDGSVTGTEFYAKYMPTCFSRIVNLGGTPTCKSGWVTMASKYASSDFCTAVYSAGPYKIKCKDDDGVWQTYDVTWDEKTGRATTVEFVDSGLYSKPRQMIVDDYDPALPEGEMFLDSCDQITAHNLYDDDITWFGGKSDAYPFVSFDVVIDSDTPEGVYYVGFRSRKTMCDNYFGSVYGQARIADNLMPLDGDVDKYTDHPDGERLNDRANWLKIVVGNPDENTDTTYADTADINADGVVDLADATEVLSIYAESAAGLDSTVPIQKSGNIDADVNGDGIVDITDANIILNQYAMSAANII